MSPFGTERDFPRLWRTVQDAARAAGARDALRTFLHGYYGARFDVDQWAVFGPPQEVAARPAEHVRAGITKLMLGVPSLDLAHLRRIARDVAPAVRACAGAAR